MRFTILRVTCIIIFASLLFFPVLHPYLQLCFIHVFYIFFSCRNFFNMLSSQLQILSLPPIPHFPPSLTFSLQWAFCLPVSSSMPSEYSYPLLGQLNGLEVANLERTVLLMDTDQNINAPLILQSLKAHRVTTCTGQATLNGIRTEGEGCRCRLLCWWWWTTLPAILNFCFCTSVFPQLYLSSSIQDLDYSRGFVSAFEYFSS